MLIIHTLSSKWVTLYHHWQVCDHSSSINKFPHQQKLCCVVAVCCETCSRVTRPQQEPTTLTARHFSFQKTGCGDKLQFNPWGNCSYMSGYFKHCDGSFSEYHSYKQHIHTDCFRKAFNKSITLALKWKWGCLFFCFGAALWNAYTCSRAARSFFGAWRIIQHCIHFQSHVAH